MFNVCSSYGIAFSVWLHHIIHLYLQWHQESLSGRCIFAYICIYCIFHVLVYRSHESPYDFEEYQLLLNSNSSMHFFTDVQYMSIWMNKFNAFPYRNYYVNIFTACCIVSLWKWHDLHEDQHKILSFICAISELSASRTGQYTLYPEPVYPLHTRTHAKAHPYTQTRGITHAFNS